MSYFYPLKHGTTTLEKMNSLAYDFLPKNHLNIGKTLTGSLSMSLDDKDYGSVFIYYSDEEPKKIASSFTEFLNGLVDYGDDGY